MQAAERHIRGELRDRRDDVDGLAAALDAELDRTGRRGEQVSSPPRPTLTPGWKWCRAGGR
jgi:hypothetical protein